MIHQVNVRAVCYIAELRGEMAHIRSIGYEGEKALIVPDALILRLAREIEARRTLSELER